MTDELFADRPEFRGLITNFPRVIPLVARLGTASPALPLESMLYQLREEAADYPARHLDLTSIRYYLQGLIWECEHHWHSACQAATNHLALLDRIQRWRRGRKDRVVFATFNYDRLFEYAASFYMSEGREIYRNAFEGMDSYTNPEFPLIKLHGSIDWSYRVNTPLPIVEGSGQHVWQIAWEVIRRYPELDISQAVTKSVERPPAPQDGHAFLPALALPINAKADFVCPPSHIAYLQDRLPSITAVLTIGWRATEPHFLNLLRAHLRADVKIVAVSGSVTAAQDTLANLRDAGIAGGGDASTGGFSDLVVGPELDPFLSGCLA